MADLNPDGEGTSDVPAERGRNVRRWVGTLVGGVAAITGGVGGCLLFLVVLLAPLLIFLLVFGQGILSIFER